MGKQQKLKEIRRELRMQDGGRRSFPLGSYALAALLVAGAGIVGWNLLDRKPLGSNEKVPEASVTLSPEAAPQTPEISGANMTHHATIRTAKGDIKIELYGEAAPRTVANFIKLANDGFYDGTTFHRVIPDFVIQGGDPNSKNDDPSDDGRGGPGYQFEDEINPRSLGLSESQITQLEQQGYAYSYELVSLPVDTQYLAMANSGPGTNGSQFFIVTGPAQKHLYGKHTVFGKVIEGFDVALKISQGDKIEKIVVE